MGNVITEVKHVLTAHKRSRPDFIIIGAQKSGTTSLYSYLKQHPDCIPSYKKETHYFDTYYTRGFLWYRSHFPYIKQLKDRRITGEASPSYLCHPRTPERINKKLPCIKLIVLLRNPTNRALSSYMHQRRAGREKLLPMKAFKKEESRIGSAVKKIKNRKWGVKKYSKKFRRYSYLRRGVYIKQLKRYFRYFSSKQMLIKCSEHFFADPRKTLREIFKFLNIDPGFVPRNMQPKNVTNYSKFPEITTGVHNFLDEYYDSYNKKLFRYLNVRYPW